VERRTIGSQPSNRPSLRIYDAPRPPNPPGRDREEREEIEMALGVDTRGVCCVRSRHMLCFHHDCLQRLISLGHHADWYD